MEISNVHDKSFVVITGFDDQPARLDTSQLCRARHIYNALLNVTDARKITNNSSLKNSSEYSVRKAHCWLVISMLVWGTADETTA